MLRLRFIPLIGALLAGCSDDPHARILAAPPAPTPPIVVSAEPPAPARAPAPAPAAPSPVEAHDYELDRFVVSSSEILAAVLHEDALYVARTTDGGKTWSRTRVDVDDPHIWHARFERGGTQLYVEMFHGMNSTYDFTFASRDRGVTWKRLRGGFGMKPPPKITSSSSSSRS